jgi:hypothetical protein
MEILNVSNRYYNIQIIKASTDETTNYEVDVNDEPINSYIFKSDAIDKVFEIASVYTCRLLDEIKRTKGKSKLNSVNDILLATSYNYKQVLQIKEKHINPLIIKYATKYNLYLYYCELFDVSAFYLINLNILEALDNVAKSDYYVVHEDDVVIM